MLFHPRIETKKVSLSRIPYDSDTNLDRLPTSVVLSIIQLSFQAGVDMLDQLQPAATLWRSSLEYVSTIPGFRSLHWAPVNQGQAPAQTVMILIEWDSGLAWKQFQCSMGFSLLLGYLSGDSFNRCIQLELPTEISRSDCILELISYQFPSIGVDLSSAQIRERKQSFKNQWDSTFQHIFDNNHAELISYRGDWLERDFGSENRNFIGLLFWKSSMQAGGLQWLLDANAHSISGQISALTQLADTVVSFFTKQLHHESSDTLKPQELVSLPASIQTNYKHPILNLPVTRCCNITTMGNQAHPDPVQMKTREQAKLKQRICTGPGGSWYPMAAISQHSMPRKPALNGPQESMIEMVSFCMQTNDSQAVQLFKELRMNLWKLRDSPLLRSGAEVDKNAGSYSQISLLLGMYSPLTYLCNLMGVTN